MKDYLGGVTWGLIYGAFQASLLWKITIWSYIQPVDKANFMYTLENKKEKKKKKKAAIT